MKRSKKQPRPPKKSFVTVVPTLSTQKSMAGTKPKLQEETTTSGLLPFEVLQEMLNKQKVPARPAQTLEGSLDAVGEEDEESADSQSQSVVSKSSESTIPPKPTYDEHLFPFHLRNLGAYGVGVTLGVRDRRQVSSRVKAYKESDITSLNQQAIRGSSLWVFSSQNRFRQVMFRLASNKVYLLFINSLSLVAGIIVAFADPLSDTSTGMNEVCRLVSQITTYIVFSDGLVNMVAFGFVLNGPNSYLRQGFTMVEFIASAFIIIDHIFWTGQYAYLSCIRVVRAFPLLKLVWSNASVHKEVFCVVNMLPQLISFNLMVTLLCTSFSALGVHIWSHDTYVCVGYTCTSRSQCIDQGGDWVLTTLSWRDTIRGLTRVFLFITGTNKHSPELSGWRLVVSCCAVWFWSFIILNSFVARVIHLFNKENEHLEHTDKLDRSQRAWIEQYKFICGYSLSNQPEILRQGPRRMLEDFWNSCLWKWLDCALQLLALISFGFNSFEVSESTRKTLLAIQIITLVALGLQIIALWFTYSLASFRHLPFLADAGFFLVEVVRLESQDRTDRQISRFRSCDYWHTMHFESPPLIQCAEAL